MRYLIIAACLAGCAGTCDPTGCSISERGKIAPLWWPDLTSTSTTSTF